MAAPSAPFGIIIPGRPVQVESTAISPTQYAFSVPASPSFSHLVIFILPGTTLPENTLAGVYIQLPSASSSAFQLLGGLSTDKQSAIFKISGLSKETTNFSISANGGEMMDADGLAPSAEGTLTVGISIEPTSTLLPQLEALKSNQGTKSVVGRASAPASESPASTKTLAQRIIKNAFNFLSGLASSPGPQGQEMVPLKSFQDWWAKFERRIENDPGFLERQED